MAKTILIVDDSSSLRQVVKIALNNVDYDVVEAGEGKEALAKLDGTRYHLIISDVNMPNMDGIALLKAIKQHQSYKFTPVLMLTTEAGEAKEQEGQAAGCYVPASRRRTKNQCPADDEAEIRNTA